MSISIYAYVCVFSIIRFLYVSPLSLLDVLSQSIRSAKRGVHSEPLVFFLIEFLCASPPTRANASQPLDNLSLSIPFPQLSYCQCDEGGGEEEARGLGKREREGERGREREREGRLVNSERRLE